MKKFYSVLTLALAGAIAASAAVPFTQKEVVGKDSQKTSLNIAKRSVVVESIAKAQAKAPATIDDICGEWVLSAYSFFTGEGAFTNDLTISKIDDATVRIDGMVYDDYFGVDLPILASYDGSGNLSIAEQEIGTITLTTGTYPLVVKHGHWNGSGWDDGVASPINGIVSGNTISFDEDDAFSVLVEGLDDAWLFYYGEMTATRKEPEVPDTRTWTVLGTGKMSDPWIYVGFMGTASPEYDVTIAQCNEDVNTYRVVNPYKNEIYSDVNSDANAEGYIEFNIANPAVAPFAVGPYCGFNYNRVSYYCYDNSGLVINMGIPADQAAEFLDSYGLPYATYNAETNTVEIPAGAACFGVTGAIDYGYGWSDEDENPVTCAGYIILPDDGNNGVNDIAVDGGNGKVEFFNLQGVRVEQPTAAGVYVRCEGGKASKVIIR